MSREIANKLNQILYLRGKQHREKQKSTGILKLLERRDEDISSKGKGFDKYFKDHIKEGIKSRNIRGLFRVPDVSAGEHLKINTVESDNENDSDEEQEMQKPESEELQLPQSKEKHQVEHPKVMMSYPLNKPIKKEDDDLPLLRPPINLKPLEDEGDETIIRKLYGISQDENEIYKIEKESKTLDDYISYSKSHPGEAIAVMNPWSREPYFVLKNNGRQIKLYHGQGLSKYYSKYPQEIRTMMTKAHAPSSEFFGEVNEDKVDEIRLQKHPVKFDINKLPDDVVLVSQGKNDDDDDDKGGNKEQSSRKLPTEKDMQRRWNEAQEAESSIPSEDEEEEKQPILGFHKPRDQDDDDDEEFGTPKSKLRKSSDDYKLEIGILESEKDRLLEDMQKTKVEIPKLQDINKELLDRLAEYQREVDMLKQIEESAEKDFKSLQEEYVKQREEIQQMNLTKRELERRLETNKEFYDEEIMKYIRKYETVREEATKEIEYLKEQFNQQLVENRNLLQGIEEGNRHANQIQAELNEYKQKFHDLEIRKNQELNTLNRKIQQQEGNYQSSVQAEISQLRQYINNIETEKNQYQNKINELILELENTKNYASNKYDEVLNEKRELEEKVKEKDEEIESFTGMGDRLKNLYQNEYRKIVSDAKAEYETKLNQQQEVINQLVAEIENLKRPHTEEIKINEETIPSKNIRQSTSMIIEHPLEMSSSIKGGAAMHTRSQGPAETGSEMIQEIADPQGNIIWRGEAINLAGKEYSIPEVVTNLVKPSNSNQLKNFKNAYELWKRDKGDKSTFNTVKSANEAINLLEDKLQHNKQNVAIVMKSIIDTNPRVLKEFKDRYEKEYDKYLRKK